MLLSMVSVPAMAAFTAGQTSASAIFIEAEDGKFDKSGGFTKVKDSAASGGSYIVNKSASSSEKLTDPDSKNRR